MTVSQLLDVSVPHKLKLCALWASTMFCYIYCDYFAFYIPGKLESVLEGKMGPLGAVTQQVLMGTAVLMAIPSLMVFLSVALPAKSNRILNITLGAFYTLLMALLAYAADWYFYKFFAVIEAALTALVFWYAWNWPRAEAPAMLPHPPAA